MRAVACVGRIGGLAVALGIGVATGGAGVAWAAPADSSDSSASVDASSSTKTSTVGSTARSRGGRAPRPAAAVVSNGQAPAASNTQKDVPAATGERVPEVSVPKQLSSSAAAGSARRVRLPGLLKPAAVVQRGATSATVPALMLAAPLADVPQMSAAQGEPAAASAVVELAWSPLLGSNPGAPVGSPMSWMVMAAARRQLDQTKTAAAPAVAVSTDQVVALTMKAVPSSAAATSATPNVIATVSFPTGTVPLSVLVSPDTTRAYIITRITDPTTSVRQGAVTVINTANNAITASIAFPTDTAPISMAFGPNGSRAYITTSTTTNGLISQSGVSIIDTSNYKVTASIAMPTNSAPTSIAIAPNGSRAYITTITADVNTGINRSAVAVIDTATNAITATIQLPTSDGAPTAVVVAPNGSRAYVTNAPRDGSGASLSVIDTTTNRITATIALPGAIDPDLQSNGLAVTPDGKRMYVSTFSKSSTVSSIAVIDTATNVVTSSISLPSRTVPLAVKVSPDGKCTYVTTISSSVSGGTLSGAVSVIDTATNKPTATIATVDGYPLSVAFSPNRARAYIASVDRFGSAGVVSVIATGIPATNVAPIVSGIALGSPNATTGAVTGTVTATDPDGDKVTFKATTSTKGKVTITTAGVFTYTPTAVARHAAAKSGAATSVTTDTVTVTVTDAKGAVTSQAVTVTLNPLNAVPVPKTTVGTPNASTGVVTGTVAATDVDKDALTYTVSTTPKKGTVVVTATGAFTYTPTATARRNAAKAGATAADKADAFTVTVTDGYGGSVAVAVSVVVSPTTQANRAPVAGTPTVGTPNGSTGIVTGSVTATDADADAITYSAPTSTSKGAVTVNASTGSFTYTPNATARSNAGKTGATAADKADTFTVTITDGYGGSVAVQVNVAVSPRMNNPPVAGTVVVGTSDSATGVVTGTVTASDPDGNQLTYSGSATTSKGTVTVSTSTGAFTYTPTSTARLAAGTVGATAASKTDTFTVTASDSFGGSTPIPVTVTVSPVNPVQIITADTTWSMGQNIDLTGRKVQVSPGVTLTIQNGVNVTGGTIDVWGTLKAVGTKAQPVTFTNTDMAYIGTSEQSPASLDIAYTLINGGSIQRPTGNGVYGSLKLVDSTVKDTTTMMYVWYPTADVDIERNSFINAGGISVGHGCGGCQTGPTVTISNNLFVNQTTDFAIKNWASYSGVTLVTGNSFLSQDRIALRLPAGYTYTAMSASNNYFGTTDIAIISQMIFDKNDDLSSAGYISTSFTSSPSPNTPSLA